jgi:rhodanese-related sulfurtransferase
VELLPTHGAGSFCSSQDGGGERRALLADERPRNVVLASPDYESFRVLHLANPGPIPAYYRHMAPINRSGPRIYGTPPRPALLAPRMLEAEVVRGTPVLDLRSRFEFARAHVPDSISLEEGDATLAYVSWVTPFNSPLVLVTEDGAQADRCTVDLLRIGYEEVRGYLPFAAWRAERQVANLQTVTVQEAARIREEGLRPVYDVRFDSDRRDLALHSSRPMPIDRLTEWIDGDLARDPLLVCGAGSRATTVGSLLKTRGLEPSVLIDGGAADLSQPREDTARA